MRISCIKGRQKPVGKGLYRQVFKVGNLALKVERWRGKRIDGLGQKAVTIDSHQRGIREKLDFLPAYYGTILAEVVDDGVRSPAIVTFHDYAKPISVYSVKTLMATFKLIQRASEKGYVLDIKPSNFGRKGKRILYLDEYGIGKGPIPPDLLENLTELVQLTFKKLTVKKGDLTTRG